MNVEFIDTNILVYAHDRKAERKRLKSDEILKRLVVSNSGAVSIQVLTEFYAAAITKLGIRSEQAEEIIDDFRFWTLHRPAHADLLRAAALRRRYNLNWWDALILNSATELGCDLLWTEDFSDGQRYGAVTVRNPFL